MRKALQILLVLLITSQAAWAQRLTTGLTAGVTGYQRMELPDKYIFPEHSYFIYYIGNEKKDYKPIREQFVNGFMAGLNISVDYKRLMFTAEILGSSTSIKLPAFYPSYLGNQLGQSWGTFNVTENALVLPVFLTYKITQKANGPYLLGGVQYSFTSYTENNDGLDSEVPGGMGFIFLSETEMYGILYNQFSYASYLAGAGYKHNDSYFAMRVCNRIVTDPAELPLAKFFRVNFTYSKTLNFQKLRKGHIIYTD